MNRSIYLITSEGSAGKSLISLGLLNVIALKTPKIAYFKPIGDSSKIDPSIMAILNCLNSKQDYQSATLFSVEELMQAASLGKTDELYSRIIAHYQQLLENYDFVLVEGISPHANISVFEHEFDFCLAKNLNIPIGLCLKDDHSLSAQLWAQNLLARIRSLEEKELEIAGIFINQSKRQDRENLLEILQNSLGKETVIAIYPFIPLLSKATLLEIQQELQAKVLYNSEKIETTIPMCSLVGAMQLSNFLTRLQELALIIIPGDRSDLLLGALFAHHSPNFPNLAGIILTGNIELENSVKQLLSESPQNNLPILAIETGTFESAEKIAHIKSTIFPENHIKIQLSIQTFKEYTDVNALLNKIASFNSDEWITPKMFQYNIVRLAKKYQQHIVLPEGDDLRVLQAASMIASEGIANLTILGREIEILSEVNRLNLAWDKSRIAIVDPANDARLEDYAQTLYQLRAHKGLSLENAHDLILDSSYFGTMMVYKNHASGMVSGAKHTTAHTIRPALQFIKSKANCDTISSVFFMLLEDRVLAYGDCAIVPNPNSKELATIAISTAETAKSFGINPRIALLSYSSGNSGSGEGVDKVREATTLAKEIIQQQSLPYLIEGPIQYDAAVDEKVARQKMPNSQVAGRANVLIFPDLNTGNNTYKAVQRESKSIAIGPVLQGLRKPVNDLSRGALVEDIYNTIIITAIQAYNC